MRDIVERAWRTAAQCAVQADETTDVEIKEFFIKRRNAWIEAANRLELLGFTEEQCILIGDLQSEPQPAHRRGHPTSAAEPKQR
jgi:hypothetical protein